jgi:hypothetical protein
MAIRMSIRSSYNCKRGVDPNLTSPPSILTSDTNEHSLLIRDVKLGLLRVQVVDKLATNVHDPKRAARDKTRPTAFAKIRGGSRFRQHLLLETVVRGPREYKISRAELLQLNKLKRHTSRDVARDTRTDAGTPALTSLSL